MREAARRYQQTVHYLQYKLSALQAVTRAARNLKAAYARLVVSDPAVQLLEEVRADIEVALREARGMANLDDAAPAPAGKPAA